MEVSHPGLEEEIIEEGAGDEGAGIEGDGHEDVAGEGEDESHE